jgi:hypothetical protein
VIRQEPGSVRKLKHVVDNLDSFFAQDSRLKMICLSHYIHYVNYELRVFMQMFDVYVRYNCIKYNAKAR